MRLIRNATTEPFTQASGCVGRYGALEREGQRSSVDPVTGSSRGPSIRAVDFLATPRRGILSVGGTRSPRQTLLREVSGPVAEWPAMRRSGYAKFERTTNAVVQSMSILASRHRDAHHLADLPSRRPHQFFRIHRASGGHRHACGLCLHDRRGCRMVRHRRHHSRLTAEQIIEAVERRRTSLDDPGFCVACGGEAAGVEPDAENYECAACGELQVFGAEALLIRIAP